jgi:hypothetical protein
MARRSAAPVVVGHHVEAEARQAMADAVGLAGRLALDQAGRFRAG